MGDAKRPRRIMLEKSDDGVTYKKWVIRVTDINDCAAQFNVPPNFAPKTIDDVVCSTFANDVVPPSYEVVSSDIYPELVFALGMNRKIFTIISLHDAR